jgi:hypothetical protein
MWVQFISPHSLDYWIHYFSTKSHSLWPMNSNWTSNEITWHTRTHFSYWGGTLMCTHPFNNCNCDMLTCCRRGAWSQFGIFRSRWVWFVGIGANGRLGYPLVVHLLDFLCLLFGDWIRHDDVIRGRYWQRIPARSFLVYWRC